MSESPTSTSASRTVSVDDITVEDFFSTDSDALVKAEEEDWDEARKRALVEGLRQDIAERKAYANKVFKLVCFWLFGLFILLLLAGFPRPPFYLSDSVLIAIISGTTVNVLGLFAIVANYLFPKRLDPGDHWPTEAN